MKLFSKFKFAAAPLSFAFLMSCALPPEQPRYWGPAIEKGECVTHSVDGTHEYTPEIGAYAMKEYNRNHKTSFTLDDVDVNVKGKNPAMFEFCPKH